MTALVTEETIAFGKTAGYYLDVNPTSLASLRVAKSLGYVEYMEHLIVNTRRIHDLELIVSLDEAVRYNSNSYN